MDFRSICKIVSTDQIPTVTLEEGVRVKVISGHLANIRGPMDEDSTHTEYLEVSLPPEAEWQHRIPADHTAFLHVVEGTVITGGEKLIEQQLGLYREGDHVEFKSGSKGARFLLISSRSTN